jgi:hypothetical protein
MSKVKIQGNASGTGVVTLTAPNTNTDRTITLPDGDITLGGGVDGIVSTADATAITIDASENVGIGTASPQTILHVESTNPNIRLTDSDSGGYYSQVSQEGNSLKLLADSGAVGSGRLRFYNGNTQRLEITSDGRGLSPFTAKAWVNFNGTGTVAIRDSHNVSSITDYGTGDYGANFSNNMANSNYNAVSSGKFYSWDSSYLIDSTTTSYLQIASVRSSNNTYEDTPIITAIVFGD